MRRFEKQKNKITEAISAFTTPDIVKDRHMADRSPAACTYVDTTKEKRSVTTATRTQGEGVGCRGDPKGKQIRRKRGFFLLMSYRFSLSTSCCLRPGIRTCERATVGYTRGPRCKLFLKPR